MRPSDNTSGLRYFIRRGRGTALVAFSALLAACSSLLGVEDLNEGPRPGDEEGGSSGATSGKGGTGGSSGGAGGARGGSAGSTSGSGGAAAGSAGKAPTGGSAGVNAVGGTAGTMGGSGGDAGDGMGGDIGMAGMGEGGMGGTTPADMTVRGRIIDFYRHPVPGVTIDIAGTEVLTNAQGEFVVPDVPATYDASSSSSGRVCEARRTVGCTRA